MKPNVNSVTITGRIGNEVELHKTKNDTPVCNIRLCNKDHWTDKKTNEKKESDTWVTCVGWSWVAEEMNKQAKGEFVQVTGKITNRQRIKEITGKEPFVYTVTEIHVESISKLD